MSKRLQAYPTESITVTFDPEVCQHSGVCLRALPMVFDVHRKHWVRPELASADDVAGAIRRCPSGALQYVIPDRQSLFRSTPETAGETRILLVKAGPKATIYFRRADIQATFKLLQSRGVEFQGAPYLIHRDDAGLFGPAGEEERMAFFQDPDGNQLAIASRIVRWRPLAMGR